MERLGIVWEWNDGSYDRVQCARDTQGWRITGRHGDTRYMIGLTTSYLCQSLEVTTDRAAITLNRTSAGWIDTNMGLVPNSAAALDLDLSWSAVTNSFPIKRLMQGRQDEGTFDVLMVTEPTLELTVVKQSYTRWEDGWIYANRSNGYTADLKVDKSGWVTDYPDLCSRKDLS